MTHFQILKSIDGQWYWRLVASNNEVLAASENFTRKRDAFRAAKRLAEQFEAQEEFQIIERLK